MTDWTHGAAWGACAGVTVGLGALAWCLALLPTPEPEPDRPCPDTARVVRHS